MRAAAPGAVGHPDSWSRFSRSRASHSSRASSWPARFAIPKLSRPRSSASSRSTSCRAAASASASPTTASASACSRSGESKVKSSSANAVRFRAQEVLPIPVDEAVLDFQVAERKHERGGGRSSSGSLLVVAYRDLVERYTRRLPQGRPEAPWASSRSVRAAPRACREPRPGRPGAAQRTCRRGGRPRSVHLRRLGRPRSASSRACSTGAARHSTTPVAHALEFSAVTEAACRSRCSSRWPMTRSCPPTFTGSRRTQPVRRSARAVESFARDLVLLPRFYQSQPDSLAIRELVLSGEPPSFRASPRSSSACSTFASGSATHSGA